MACAETSHSAVKSVLGILLLTNALPLLAVILYSAPAGIGKAYSCPNTGTISAAVSACFLSQIVTPRGPVSGGMSAWAPGMA